MNQEEAAKAIVDGALAGGDGAHHIRKAEDYLSGELGRGQFNTERAIEVFAMAIDNAVWAFIKDMPVRAAMHKDYKQSGLGAEMARKLTAAFVARTGAKDQRQARRWFRSVLGA